MRLSDERIRSLQVLLKELYGLDYTHEQTQEASLAIMRFVIVRDRHEHGLTINKENENE